MSPNAAPDGRANDRSPAATTLGERVRERRLVLGLSQETVAELAGIHWTFVGQVERGRRNVTLHNLVRLADALDVDPGVLVSGISIDQVPALASKERKAEEIRRSRRPDGDTPA